MRHFLPLLIVVCCFFVPKIQAQDRSKAENKAFDDKFRQLEEILPTANAYRTASGAPGHEYWQQQADYKMKLELDDESQKIYGEETITYTNNSPDALAYLWLQLDQNHFQKDGMVQKTESEAIGERMTVGTLARLNNDFDGGFKVEYVRDMADKALPFTIVETMMRVDLPKPLRKGEKFNLKIKWWFNVIDRLKLGGRSGWEYFADEKNYLYTIAQHYPRMCVYSDVTGWQHKQFLGAGEFTLSFGNYEVALTVPADHVVGATGVLQNPNEVLTAEQRQRWQQAKQSYENPVAIVTEADARTAEKGKATTKKTWVFKAENVRDVAFCSSRKFIWDAMAVKQSTSPDVMAMSYYPKEGNPLWEKYSTKAVAHTVKWYSHYTFDYPYPVAISVHTDQIGMEYPMICFNGGRPDKDGTYSERTKYGMISVIIHEVGHNYFPMIVNSDERQWTWMDEGLNSFTQYLTEQQWERDYPSRRGPAANLVDYMKGGQSRLEPIMTNSESLRQFGNNAYGKPATALNILRETVMGRDLFDFAFKTYANRWKFKHPMPADFFRTMEDASGVDLDWFWRGWFYTTDYVDVAIDKVKAFRIDTKNPEIEAAKRKAAATQRNIGSIRNEKVIKATYDEQDKSLRDKYSDDNPYEVTQMDKETYQRYLTTLSKEEKDILSANDLYYEVTFELKGELLSPIVVELQMEDGTKEYHNIPAEIWRAGDRKVSKVFRTKQEVKQVILDPYLETVDIDVSNNYFPNRPQPSRFELFKRGK
jgi:Peptidase family M1 domain